MPFCGIYQIKNVINGKKYVGKSKNIVKRLRDHLKYLKTKNNKYENDHFINAFHKYGEENFEASIIAICSEKDLNIYEQWFINIQGCANPEYGYNKTYGGDGVNPTEETKKKLSEALTGRTIPREENKLTKSFARVIKSGKNKQGKQIWKIHYDNKIVGRSQDKEFLEQLLKKYFDEKGFLKDNFEKTKQNISRELKQYGIKQMSFSQSENHNTIGYRNVSKKGNRYVYRYTDKGVRKHIQAYSIEILKEKVQKQKLKWEKFA